MKAEAAGPTVTDWDGTPGAAVATGVRLWEARGSGVQMIRVEFAAGTTLPPHEQDRELLLLVLEGQLEVAVQDDCWTVGAGQVVHLPANVRHGVRVVGSGPAVTIEVYAPPRDDLPPAPAEPTDTDAHAEGR